MIHRNRGAPFSKVVTAQFWLNVAFVQLALPKARLDHTLDGIIERAVAKTIGLNADLHAVNLGINASQRRDGYRRQRQL